MIKILHGCALEKLQEVDDGSIAVCITSPPYWGISEYEIPPSKWAKGNPAILGKEESFGAYVEHLVEVFDIIRRKLRPDGVLWVIVKDLSGTFFEAMKKSWEGEVYDLGSEKVYRFFKTKSRGSLQEVVDKWIDLLSTPLFVRYPGYLFGTFPTSLIIPMVEVSTVPGETLLDPFAGVGTLGVIAKEYGMNAILIEADLNAANLAKARLRL